MNKVLLLVCFWIFSFQQTIQSQDAFSVSLNPIEISGVGGLQSFVVGQHQGKWLVMGGRLDGLHRRQPWASFDLAGHNDRIWVIDPITDQSWVSEMTTLPVSIQEQLRSTNMEFYQDDEQLYVIGGYGFSVQADDHITFPSMVAVDVPQVIDAIVNDGDLTPFFRQISDENMAVTGGYLERIGNMFYLVGGQRFDGRYNPMDMPTFTQEYTDAIRRFLIEDDGTNLNIVWQEEWNDAENLHRRDFNVLPQIMPNGNEGLTAFSGVFQPDADIPFLDCVNITESGYAVQADFSQYYNHYHCASIPLFSESAMNMHTLFFGGIAQYYESQGELVMDDAVPFVKTIARVTRSADGTMTEYKLPIEMPALLGSGAEFIPLQGLGLFTNGVIDLDALLLTEVDSVLIGHIYGGIESSDLNIFFINDGTQSEASSTVFEVYLKDEVLSTSPELNSQSNSPMRMQLYPNAQIGILYVDLMLPEPCEVMITLSDTSGRSIAEKTFPKSRTVKGENGLSLQASDMLLGNIYIVTARSQYGIIGQKMMVNE